MSRTLLRRRRNSVNLCPFSLFVSVTESKNTAFCIGLGYFVLDVRFVPSLYESIWYTFSIGIRANVTQPDAFTVRACIVTNVFRAYSVICLIWKKMLWTNSQYLRLELCYPDNCAVLLLYLILCNLFEFIGKLFFCEATHDDHSLLYLPVYLFIRIITNAYIPGGILSIVYNAFILVIMNTVVNKDLYTDGILRKYVPKSKS